VHLYNKIRILLFILIQLLLINKNCNAQSSTILFIVTDEENKALEGANIVGINNTHLATNEKGKAIINVIPNIPTKYIISYVGYKSQDIVIAVGVNEYKEIHITLKSGYITAPVDIVDNSLRNEPGLEKIEMKLIETLPNISGGVESLLKTLPGVMSNNELSSQYSVRGGSYDENLIFINDFEIYRPQLVHSSQQEGLSFPNPNLIQSLTFSTGGFQSKFGDKMSSVMNVVYKKPNHFRGSLSLGLLNSSFNIEGSNKNKNLKFLLGIRNRSSGYLLKSLETDGQYRPSSNDVQAFISYDLSPTVSLELLGNIAHTRFYFVPISRSTKFGVFNEVKQFDVQFDSDSGEDDKYTTYMLGTSIVHRPKENVKLKYLLSAYRTKETEYYNKSGVYTLADVETDLSSNNLGDTKNITGYGFFQDWARNTLYAQVYNFAHIGTYQYKDHEIQWGGRIYLESIQDKISEWNRVDSAGYIENGEWTGGYTLPYSPDDSILLLNQVLKTKNTLQAYRGSMHIQDTWGIGATDHMTLAYGIRANYHSVTNEMFIMPRVQLAYAPKWYNKRNEKRDWIFKFAMGIYNQVPFYRELRNLEGQLNTKIKSQKSIHLVLASDYQFKAWGKKMKFTTEAYYKYMYDLIPYEIDNVLIRYYGDNISRGYARGIDLRINGEFIPDAESWFTLSLLQTKEDLIHDVRNKYRLEDGKIVEFPNKDIFNPIVDTIQEQPGFIARPTNQLINAAIFFQDYLPKNKNFRTSMTINFGSGLPFGPADGKRYNDVFYTPIYMRMDIGFSATLYDQQNIERTPKGFFTHLSRAWITAEVYNLLGVYNTVSYLFFKDFANREYGIPNYLTPRRISARLNIAF